MSVPLEEHATVFEVKVITIKICCDKLGESGIIGQTYILSDSHQASGCSAIRENRGRICRTNSLQKAQKHNVWN